VSMAILLGATYVARGFSGDKPQLVPLIEGALLHNGIGFLDVISPCVAFNNHSGSTKSFDYVREHNDAVNTLDVMVPREEITAEYPSGSTVDVTQHDGSVVRLHKLEEDYDPTDKLAAMAYLQARHQAGEVVTGLLHIRRGADDLNQRLNTVEVPLNGLGEDELCPGAPALAAINAALR
jgi:2-oxoglutarate/2-oxoacid ferredoxin oxidoreductase subunit beta